MTSEVSPADGPSRTENWRSWIDYLRRNLLTVHHNRQMWKAVTDAIISTAPAAPATWSNHYTRMYVEGQAMAIRRLIRAAGRDTITLGKLMEDMERHADLLARDAYVALVTGKDDDDHWVTTMGHHYDATWSDGRGRLNLTKLRGDIQDLHEVARNIVSFAGNAIAHITDETQPTFTYGQLDGAIDHISNVFQSYAALVTGVHFMLRPAIQDNWEAAFYRPLFPPPNGWPPNVGGTPV